MRCWVRAIGGGEADLQRRNAGAGPGGDDEGEVQRAPDTAGHGHGGDAPGGGAGSWAAWVTERDRPWCQLPAARRHEARG